jgi:predicted AlkP superfamily pyrophosphatase or phosphodiesterase
MRSSLRVVSLFTVALATGAACSRATTNTEPGIVQQGALRPLKGRVTDHVVVISIDGLRPDAISRFNATTLQRLMREGRYSLTAQTISISRTLPSHTSMLTGVDVDVHGIHWNSDKTGNFGYVKVPTVFGLAHEAGFSTAAIFSKTKFHHLAPPNTIDFVKSPQGPLAVLSWPAQRTADYVDQYLGHAKPNLLFVHIAEPDFAAHRFGWMSGTYGRAVREADVAVGRILGAAEEKFGHGRYTVVLTSDHGGHDKTHGSTDPRDMTIPWIVWGAGVQHGDTLSGIRTMDTAATILWMLGVESPPTWSGRAVSSAFEPTIAVGGR